MYISFKTVIESGQAFPKSIPIGYSLYLKSAGIPQLLSDLDMKAIPIGNKEAYLSMEIKKTLLAAPFATDCWNYPGIGYKSRADCINRCMEENYIERLGNIPYYYPTDPGKRAQLKFSQNQSEWNIANKLEEFCTDKKCVKEDCEQDSFLPTRIYSDKRSEFKGNTSHVEIYMPKSPITRYIYQPRREFAEFVNYFASACDLWLDFIGIAGIGSLLAIITKRLSRKNQTLPEDQLFQRVIGGAQRLKIQTELEILKNNFEKFPLQFQQLSCRIDSIENLIKKI